MEMKLPLLCLVLFAPSVFCIYLGHDAEIYDDTRSIVSLQSYNESTRHYCAGVFITTKYVLTAASCVKGRQPQDFWVVAGVTDINNPARFIPLDIDRIFSKDPSGQNNVRNNIALVRISTNIPSSEGYRVNNVEFAPDGENIVADGTKCKMFGWGQKKPGRLVASEILQVATTEIKNLSDCRLFNKDVDESNICTDLGASLCYLDAGDPLISKSGKYLLGIATEHYACVPGNFRDVYTRVDLHEKWIWETIDKDQNPSSATLHKSRVIISGTGIIVILMIWSSF